ncbi:MAG: hypothetical protein IPF42_01670 [Candidatus Microthrix sp.]|nr:hypothetical protein [Candidatus Microthrix sp.]
MSTLRWTLKSTYELSREVTDQGLKRRAGQTIVGPERLLVAGPRQEAEGRTHPDRDGQFH